jgi:hypothetical protein
VRLHDVDDALEPGVHPQLEAVPDDELGVGGRLVGQLEGHARGSPPEPDRGVGVEASRGDVGALEDLGRPCGELEHAPIVRASPAGVAAERAPVPA